MNGRCLSRRSVVAGLGVGLVMTALGTGGCVFKASAGDDQSRGLPAFARRTKQATRAYQAALAQPELIAALPCYCGCALFAPPHQNLHECYVRPDGAFEEHAAWCEICQEEALDAVRWSAEGASVAEVHHRIVETYADRGPGPEGAAHGA